jgi:hypothetical protein
MAIGGGVELVQLNLLIVYNIGVIMSIEVNPEKSPSSIHQSITVKSTHFPTYRQNHNLVSHFRRKTSID